jgi:hypothetical protein
MDFAQHTRTGQVLACEEPFVSALLTADIKRSGFEKDPGAYLNRETRC